jgi:hypothetical protein
MKQVERETYYKILLAILILIAIITMIALFWRKGLI